MVLVIDATANRAPENDFMEGYQWARFQLKYYSLIENEPRGKLPNLEPSMKLSLK